ncbi:MAG: Unknown protein [uncultured Sulfurovum sp.]|uniref:Uncharacterized protein n=1 Tax=uncultured Sulfurovum sp. TaxID=269237 RepID=A0A6S6RXM4_9BACT|nr:MAG: Unknown protein [uncultured Sulfurovum sp.]
MKRVVQNIFILLIAFNVSLLASTVVESTSPETVEVALNSFGTLGIIVVIALTSIVGAFFMKDDLTEAFK